MAAAKEQGIFAPVQGSSRRTADPIANLVTCDGTKHDGEQKPLERNNA
jgi:hypothetical protein